MYKKVIIFFVMVLILGSSVFAIWKGVNKPSDEENLKLKINEEMDYIARSIINLANQLNNIWVEDYKISTKTSKASENQTEEKQGNSSSSSSSGKESASDSGSNSNSGEDNNKGSSNTTILYKMVPATQKNEQINWNQIEADLNTLYGTWSQVMIDLYEVNTNNDDILAFGRDLDEATKYIKSNDKVNSLSLIASLYNYIPKFINSYSPEDTRKVYMETTKASIINAYALIEQEKWEEIVSQITRS